MIKSWWVIFFSKEHGKRFCVRFEKEHHKDDFIDDFISEYRKLG